MKSLIEQAILDNETMDLLRLDDIRHPIYSSDKGDLKLVLPKGGKKKDYHFYLDAVPVDSNVEKVLFKRLKEGTLSIQCPNQTLLRF